MSRHLLFFLMLIHDHIHIHSIVVIGSVLTKIALTYPSSRCHRYGLCGGRIPFLLPIVCRFAQGDSEINYVS